MFIENGMRSWTWYLTATLLALFCMTATSEAQVLFEETFSNYGVQPPGMHERCRIREWPASQKFVLFEPEDESRIFTESVRVGPDNPGWENYELHFRFKLTGADSKQFALELPVRAAGQQDDRTFSIRYGGDYRLTAPGGKVTTADLGATAGELLRNQWYEGWIRVQGGELTAWLNTGVATKIGSIQMNDSLTRGFNIRTDAAVMFDHFRVTTLPANGARGHELDDLCLRAAIPTLNGQGTAIPMAEDAVHDLDIPTTANRAAATVRIGEAGKMMIRMRWADDTTTAIKVSTGAQSWQRPVIKDGKQVREKAELPDAFLFLQGEGLNLKRHVRPDIAHYDEFDILRIGRAWATLPPASQHPLEFAVRQDAAGIEIWIDRRYAGRMDSAVRLKGLTFDMAAGGTYEAGPVGYVEHDEEFLTLDAGAIACPGAMVDATLSVEPGRRVIGGIPFDVVGGDRSVDVGVVQEHRGSWALECDLYLSRTAFSGVPDTLRMSVPVAQYNRLYALCALDDDASEIPVVTARLSYFKPDSLVGVGPAIATTTVDLTEAGKAGTPGAIPVGTVKVGGRDLPLYLVEIPLDVGSIQDLMYQGRSPAPYLDLDLIGKPKLGTQQWKQSDKPDPLTRSAVHVFGLTLARSPVKMLVTPERTGNSYYPNETAGMSVALQALEPTAGILSWTVSDIDGTEFATQTRDLNFADAGDTETIAVEFDQKQTGWYRVVFTLTDKAGHLLLAHTSSFARIPAASRQATYDSPYYSWWFGGAHGTTQDVNVIGTLMDRAGIKRVNLKDEEQAADYGLTGAYLHSMHRLYDKNDLAGSEERMVAAIKKDRANLPHLDHALIFHESLSGDFPMELLGLPHEVTGNQAKDDQTKTDTAIFVAQVYRKHFPDVKLVVGNTGSSVGGLARMFRTGYPAELIDFMGEESACQTIAPEKNEAIGGTAYTFWMLQELAQSFGYDDLKPIACHERNYRSNRTLGTKKAAAWTVRDALIVHAWGSPVVPIMGPEDVSYCYSNSVWGDFGMFTRAPQTYPRPGFSAMSTLTRILDRAVFQKQLATGSLTAYALEFRRVDDSIYTLWTARGQVETTLVFDRDTTITITDLWGREVSRPTEAKTLVLKSGTDPVYLTSAAKVVSVASGKRVFPEDAVPAGSTVTIADSMNSADDWQVVETVDPRIDNPGKIGNYPPFRQVGEYRLREVADADRGDCLELELVQAGETPKIMHEYTFIKPKAPTPVPGTPQTIGVWVKGNSGWGQLMWEFQDAEGETWLSCGTGGYGCNVYDWQGQASINFDGWNFVQFPITQASPVRVESPGGVLNEWQRNGNGNGRIDYPITLTGLGVSMQRRAINLTRMEPVETVIRLKDLSAY